MPEEITTPTENVEPKKSFNDLLSDPEYQSEFDKKVAKALDTAKANWEKEEEAKRSEAERLMKMTEEERHKEELEKMRQEKAKAEADLNAYRLKEEATKIATEKGIDLSLLDLIDFGSTTAESVKEKLDVLGSTFNKAVEASINDKFKQASPKHVATVGTADPNKRYLDEKYKNNPYYKK